VKYHYHILQLPKDLSDIDANKNIDKFLTGIIHKIFSDEKLDTQTLFSYKTLMLFELDVLTTNNYHNFVFHEKTLDKLL